MIPLSPYSLLTALIGSFAGLMALTAFHAFVVVHEKKIKSPFYREFTLFFGRGGNLPILTILAFGIVMIIALIVLIEYNIPFSDFWGISLCMCGHISLAIGWIFTVFGIGCVVYNYLRKYLQVKLSIKISIKLLDNIPQTPS